MSGIPGDVEGRRQWLYDCFVEKERLEDADDIISCVSLSFLSPSSLICTG